MHLGNKLDYFIRFFNVYIKQTANLYIHIWFWYANNARRACSHMRTIDLNVDVCVVS